MSNSAVIKGRGINNKAIYLHWNGGKDSVEAFLKYCELRGFREFNGSDGYGIARFCQVVGNYFNGGLSLGITEGGDYGDHGAYIVDGWEIVDREHFTGIEQQEYDLEEMLIEIDKAQPANQQLGDYLTSPEIKKEDIKIGDIVFIRNIKGHFEKHEVIGIGKDRHVNGTNTLGLPYVSRWGLPNPEDNINNYIEEETVRIYKE